MIVIKEVKENDKNDILMLGRRIFREDDEIPLLKRALSICNPVLSRVIINNNDIIGFILVSKNVTNEYYKFLTKIPNSYEISFLGISREYQGYGLGKRLLKETLLAIFQESNQFRCWLLVDIDNVSAIRLYEKVGFRQWIKTTNGITPVPGYIMGISYKSTVKSKTLSHKLCLQSILHTVNT